MDPKTRATMGEVAIRRNKKLYSVKSKGFTGHYEDMSKILWDIDGEVTTQKVLKKAEELNLKFDFVEVNETDE